MAKFKPYQKDQLHLLPACLEDYVPEGHLARFVYEVVEGLDTSTVESKYSELGQNTYHPKILLKLLFYGYATGVRSGRKIAIRCADRIACTEPGITIPPVKRIVGPTILGQPVKT